MQPMNAFRRIHLVLFLAPILFLQSLAGMLAAGEICSKDNQNQQQMECCDDTSMASGNQPCLDMLKCSTASLPLLDSQRLKLKLLLNHSGLTQTVLPLWSLAAPWHPPRV